MAGTQKVRMKTNPELEKASKLYDQLSDAFLAFDRKSYLTQKEVNAFMDVRMRLDVMLKSNIKLAESLERSKKTILTDSNGNYTGAAVNMMAYRIRIKDVNAAMKDLAKLNESVANVIYFARKYDTSETMNDASLKSIAESLRNAWMRMEGMGKSISVLYDEGIAAYDLMIAELKKRPDLNARQPGSPYTRLEKALRGREETVAKKEMFTAKLELTMAAVRSERVRSVVFQKDEDNLEGPSYMEDIVGRVVYNESYRMLLEKVIAGLEKQKASVETELAEKRQRADKRKERYVALRDQKKYIEPRLVKGANLEDKEFIELRKGLTRDEAGGIDEAIMALRKLEKLA